MAQATRNIIASSANPNRMHAALVTLVADVAMAVATVAVILLIVFCAAVPA
jgi:hypothetical protein